MVGMRRKSQLQFARQIARAATLAELNLLREVYRAELGRQSPEREVLDLLAKAVEGHLHVRALAEPPPPAELPAPPAHRRIGPPLEQTHIKRSPECCGCPSFPNALCPVCAHHNGIF